MKPVNIAILGVGAIAGQMAKAIGLTPEARAYAVAARDAERARAFAEQYGFAHAYGSYEEMLADKEVELVYIAVPHALHSKYTLMCLEAGKNVVTEKPFAANAAQAKAMIEKAQAKGLMVAEGMWMHYVPNVEKLRELCGSGLIGDIKMFSGEIGYHLTQERLFDPAMAGGALLDIGVYAVALAGIALGYDVEEIVSNAALTERGVDEVNSLILKYRSGAMASISTSMTYMSSCRGTVWGSKGYADIDNVNRLSTITVYDLDRKEIARYTNPPVENSYQFELKALIESVRAGRLDTPQVPHDEILKRMEILDSLRRQWNVAYPFEKE